MLASEEEEKPKEGLAVMANSDKLPRGGHGGAVEIIEGTGVAEGGNGGRGGDQGYGRGGDGGGGTLTGNGYIRGGDGGDAGRPGRPALGAVSPICYADPSLYTLSDVTDAYGIPQPGKGGDSYIAYVTHDGYRYSLNILLQLIRGPVPNLIDKPELIDFIDELGIKTEQEWWDQAIQKFPEETSKVMAHMRACETK